MIFTFDPPDDAEWALGGTATIEPNAGAHSPPNVLRLFANRVFGVTSAGLAQRTVPVTPGRMIPVRLRVNGDGNGFVPVSIFLTSGGAEQQFDLAEPIGPGLQLWEPGTFTPEADTVTIVLFVTPPVSDGAGLWLIDDVELDTELADMPLAKASAFFAARDLVKALGSSPSDKTKLEQRAFTRSFTPVEESRQELPYACFSLINEDETNDYAGRGFTSRFRVSLEFWVADNYHDDKRNADEAIQALCDFRDDVIRVFMQNEQLGGQVKTSGPVRWNSSYGPGFAKTEAVLELVQIGGAADLAAA